MFFFFKIRFTPQGIPKTTFFKQTFGSTYLEPDTLRVFSYFPLFPFRFTQLSAPCNFFLPFRRVSLPSDVLNYHPSTELLTAISSPIPLPMVKQATNKRSNFSIAIPSHAESNENFSRFTLRKRKTSFKTLRFKFLNDIRHGASSTNISKVIDRKSIPPIFPEEQKVSIVLKNKTKHNVFSRMKKLSD